MRIALTLTLVLLVAPLAVAQMTPSAPGPEHAVYDALVGEWVGELHMKLPGMEDVPPATVHQSTKKALGGFWYLSEYSGTMMGMPFEGHGVAGYDPDEGKYVETWVDNMHPQMAILKGSWDAGSKTLTKLLDSKNPVNGEPVVERHQVILSGPDEYRMTMAQPGPDGEYLVFLEIVFRRAK